MELLLGFNFSDSRTVSLEWSEYCDTAVRLIVYPVYQVYSGELWEDDVWDDDDYGAFEVQELVGTELWVLKPGDLVICSEDE